MLSPRIIPCLLVRNKGLVKTVRFGDSRYVGDPINAVKIFNEKEVDELILLDIDATAEKREPDYRMIQYLADECRMPFCYGGGIKTVDQALRILGLGVEKLAVSSVAIETPEIVSRMAERIGSQSVIVVVDVKKRAGKYEVHKRNGRVGTGLCPVEFSKRMEGCGAGEIVIHSIDNDGVMKGYDYDLIDRVREAVSVPLTALGGAGSLEDIGRLIERYGIVGAAAGSLFVFKGMLRAVLINYPKRQDKEMLLKRGAR